SRRRHTRFSRDWSSDVCSSDLESNGSMLAAALAADGAHALPPRHCGDDPADLRETLDAAAREADLVLTTGGIGHGAYDVVKLLLDRKSTRPNSSPVQSSYAVVC